MVIYQYISLPDQMIHWPYDLTNSTPELIKPNHSSYGNAVHKHASK